MSKTQIAHMQYMLSCPSVTGKVSEIKRIPYYFGKEFKENPFIFSGLPDSAYLSLYFSYVSLLVYRKSSKCTH